MAFFKFVYSRLVPQLVVAICLACQPGLSLGQSGELQHGLSPAYGTPPAPELDLAGLDGHRYRLADYHGKVVIVNFWATWCPPCIAEMPTLQKVWDLLRDDKFEILAVNLGEDKETVQDFVDGFTSRLGFPVLLATDPSIMQTWRIQGLPTSHIVDTAGRIAYTEVGPRDFRHEHIISRLQELMAGPAKE